MKTPILLSIIAGLTALPLVAQDSSTGTDQQGGRKQPPPSKLVGVLDADHDKIISVTELANATVALTTLDTNTDGQLTKDEFCPPKPPKDKSEKRREENGTAKPSGNRPPPPDALVKALDTDKDRVISGTELAAASTSLATLDKNADGQLTRDEFAPKPPRKPHGTDTNTTDQSSQE